MKRLILLFITALVFSCQGWGDTFGNTNIAGTAHTTVGNGYFRGHKGVVATSNTSSWRYVVCAAGSGSTHIKLALYPAVGYGDNALLYSTGSAVIANSSSGEINITQTTKPTQDNEWTRSGTLTASLTSGTTYHIALCCDNNSTLYYDNQTNYGYAFLTVTNMYASFPPSTAPTPYENRLTRNYSIYIETLDTPPAEVPTSPYIVDFTRIYEGE